MQGPAAEVSTTALRTSTVVAHFHVGARKAIIPDSAAFCWRIPWCMDPRGVLDVVVSPIIVSAG
jgi:hypothetical protein